MVLILIQMLRKLIQKKLKIWILYVVVFHVKHFLMRGKKKTFEDDRGLLFDEIMKIAKVKNPKFMFLENVKHILKVGDGEVIKYIKSKLDKFGYVVQIFEISPHQYGIPQQLLNAYILYVFEKIFIMVKILFFQNRNLILILKVSLINKKILMINIS